MIRSFLIRGMLCGIVAGIFAFFYARQFGEPQISHAIAFETQRQLASGKPLEPEMFSRAIQSGIGLFTAIVAVGTALGGLFALGCALIYGRVGSLGTRGAAALLAAAAFVSIELVPSLKYPANPPSIGLPNTIGLRTELFFSMIAISILTMILAGTLGVAFSRRLGRWNASLLSIVVYVGGIALAQVILPDVNEVPAGFSAVLLRHFRIASIGTHVVLWSTLGLLFGYLTERAQNRLHLDRKARAVFHAEMR
jgi:predicted cobalt transporter CbtA